MSHLTYFCFLSRPPLPIGRVGRISGPATCADGALLTAPLNCDVGPIIGGLDGLRLDNIREDEDSQSELDECAEESPAEPEQIQPALESNAEESDRQLYLPRPRSAPSARPGSASSTSGSSRTVARPLSAPKWGERLPSDCSMEGGRPSSAPQGRRQPISIESLQALAGLTDDLLGIVPDEGDEKNPDDLDLVESPRRMNGLLLHDMATSIESRVGGVQGKYREVHARPRTIGPSRSGGCACKAEDHRAHEEHSVHQEHSAHEIGRGHVNESCPW